MRARLALAASKVSCQLREVILRNKPQALLDASPKGTVPVVVLPDGQIIEESLDIMLWALTQPTAPAWLSAFSTTDQQAMLALIQENDSAFKQALDRYKYPQRHAEHDAIGAEAFAKEHCRQAAEWLQGLEQRLQRHRWLFGAEPSLADYAILPFVRQFAHTDKDWFAAQPWPALLAWLDDFLHSEIFQRVMHKYSAWEPEHTPVYFPPQA